MSVGLRAEPSIPCVRAFVNEPLSDYGSYVRIHNEVLSLECSSVLLLSLTVTPYISKIVFRVYDHGTFKKDALLGDCSLDLYSVLKKNNGRCHNQVHRQDGWKSCLPLLRSWPWT